MFDWFTFLAQIVNFTILVWLLKRFLYAPIISAMDRRESDIKALFDQSTEKIAKAEDERRKLEHHMAELESLRHDKLREVEAETAEYKSNLINQTKDDVETLKIRWRENLESEISQFNEDLRLKIHTEVLQTTRKVIRDLSDRDLEEQIIRRCMKELSDNELNGGNGKTSTVIVRTTFELSLASIESLKTLIQNRLGQVATLRFETREDLIAGIEVIVDSYKTAWTVADYLDALDEKIKEVCNSVRK